MEITRTTGDMLFRIVALPVVLVASSLGAAFSDAASSMPDPQLSPGAVADADPAVVCAPGYSRSRRVWHDKTATLAKYRIPPSEAGRYEDDDPVPICLGGDNASPLNHWPELWDSSGAD
jgi:hypothetical protein